MRCTRCIFDDSIPGITFDADGVCNYCHLHDEMSAQYPIGMEGRIRLAEIADQIRKDGEGKLFDCVVGVSGGCDSSYTLWTAIRLGLRPLAVHFDNGWNSDIAEHNMRVVAEKLNVPVIRHKVDRAEFDSINMAFLRSGVPDFEAPTDIALPTIAYRAAEKFGIKWMLNGHSFRTEGVTPLGWSYMDGKYIQDVCKRYGGPEKFETYPNLWLRDFVRWSGQGYKRLRPLYYIDYQWDQAKQELADEFGWKWYGFKHGESLLTVFFAWMMRVRWGINLYEVRLAALVREGQRDRDLALAELSAPPTIDDKIMERVDKTFYGLDGERWYLDVEKRSVDEFKTYRPYFKALRPLFWLWAKQGKVPFSFYEKYCK